MKLCLPKDLKVGDRVQARDKKGFWYDAKVISRRGRGRNVKVMVKYTGYADRHNTEFAAKDEGLREPLPPAELKAEICDKLYGGRVEGLKDDGTWEIERLLQKRRRGTVTEYLVRWVGWAPEHDTWESKNLSREIIEEFAEEQAIKAVPPKLPPEPFTRALTAADSPELLEYRVADCAELLADIGGEVKERSARQKSPSAELKFYTTKPVSAGAFTALRERLVRAVPAGSLVANALTPIASLRRGQRPVDGFTVVDDDVLTNVFGLRLVYHGTTNGAAMKAVAPFDFHLRAKRDERGELLPVKELVVKAHWAGLIPNHTEPGKFIFRTDDNAFEYPDEWRTSYKMAVAKQIIDHGQMPATYIAWAQETIEQLQ
jgi:hypothetical protein